MIRVGESLAIGLEFGTRSSKDLVISAAIVEFFVSDIPQGVAALHLVGFEGLRLLIR